MAQKDLYKILGVDKKASADGDGAAAEEDVVDAEVVDEGR